MKFTEKWQSVKRLSQQDIFYGFCICNIGFCFQWTCPFTYSKSTIDAGKRCEKCYKLIIKTPGRTGLRL